MSAEKIEDSAKVFDPYAFAEKWYEDHPESLRYHVAALKQERFKESDGSQRNA